MLPDMHCDSLTTKRIKVEIPEQMDTTSEMNGVLSEYNDISTHGYLIVECKDDPNADSDSDAKEDAEVDNPEMLRCQSCYYRCRAQRVLRCHVTRHHQEEASRNGKRMCMECGQVEDTIESLQQHMEVGQFSL